jgi:hypothetical protein
MSYKNEPVEAHAVIGQIQACRMTRSELMKTLADSGFGERDAMYHAYFHRAADGSALCNTCGLQIGHHADHSDAVAAVAAQPVSRREEDEVTFPPPDCTVQQYSQDAKRRQWGIGTSSPYPLHWVGAVWYAPLIDFVGHSRKEVIGRACPTTFVRLKYRCTVDDCGKVFEMEGPRVDDRTSAAVGPISLKTMGNAESIEAHMERVHGLKHLPAGRIATELFDCCKDPAIAMTCCCPFIDLRCTCMDSPLNRSYDVGLAPHAAIARVLEPGGAELAWLFAHGRHFFVSSAPLDEEQCQSGMCCSSVILIFFVPPAMAILALALLCSIVTLFGFPCNSDSLPPLLCSPCYRHRRELIKVLDADETPFQSQEEGDVLLLLQRGAGVAGAEGKRCVAGAAVLHGVAGGPRVHEPVGGAAAVLGGWGVCGAGDVRGG